MAQEPSNKHRAAQGTEAKRTSPVAIAFLVFVFLVVLFLRHDYWNWDTPGYLLFGFLPVGLWWQAIVSILASIMMALMVRFAWPAHLERQAMEAERRRLSNPAAAEPGSPR